MDEACSRKTSEKLLYNYQYSIIKAIHQTNHPSYHMRLMPFFIKDIWQIFLTQAVTSNLILFAGTTSLPVFPF